MLNWQRISELKDEVGDDDFAEVFCLFCDEVEGVLDVLEGSTPNELAERLHFLKGSALNIGFESLSSLCKAAEMRLRDDPGASPDLVEIRRAYEAEKAALESGAAPN